ncbi:MAG: TRAP transporter permease [Sporomusaceae bacterium]|nr:TRAP transporter permease [Sporomusaceae bacterium]
MATQIENEDFQANKYLHEKIAAGIAILLALFQLYTAYFGAFGASQQRTVHLVLVLLMVFILKPLGNKPVSPWRIIDIVCIAASLYVGVYIFMKADQFALRALTIDTTDTAVGTLGLILVFEATRRVMGWIMPSIAAVFLAYAFLGPYMPSIIAHRGFGLPRIAYQMWFTMEGVLGQPLGVSATFVAVFVIFAAFLRKSGAGDFFMDIAFSLFGRYRGGPAKVAIVSSTLFGTFSGSAVANVVGTGTLTIPLMKRTGYQPHFAGAVEAVSSTGGQIMPPVMGAAAFLMTEFIGIPYTKIALAALVPALLYYFTVYVMVDLEAAKYKMVGLSKENLPSFKEKMKDGWPFLVPLVVLIYLLGESGSTPSLAAFWAIVAVVAIAAVHPKYKFSFNDFLKCMESGGRGVIEVAAACAMAGVIIGVITLTGLGLKLSMLMITLAAGSLLFLLLLTALVCFILGMGVPTTAAYLIVASLVAPALVKMGVHPLAAHMFVFYYAVVSMITPPVALAAYAAAGIAQCSPDKVGFTAIRLGIVALVVPFMFVYGPQLLLIGTWPEIAQSIVTSIFGCIAMSIAVHGWYQGQVPTWIRGLFLLGGLGLIKPGTVTDIAGVLLIVVAYFLNKKFAKKTVPSAETTATADQS